MATISAGSHTVVVSRDLLLSLQVQQRVTAAVTSLNTIPAAIDTSRALAVRQQWGQARDVISECLQHAASYTDLCEVNRTARDNDVIIRLVGHLRVISHMAASVMDMYGHDQAVYVVTRLLRMLTACPQEALLDMYLFVLRNTAFTAGLLDTARLAFTTVSEQLMTSQVCRQYPAQCQQVLSDLLYGLGLTGEALTARQDGVPLCRKILEVGMEAAVAVGDQRQQARYLAALGFTQLTSDVKMAATSLLTALTTWQTRHLRLHDVTEFMDTVNNCLMALFQLGDFSRERALRARLVWLSLVAGPHSEGFNVRLARDCFMKRAAQLTSLGYYTLAVTYYEAAYQLLYGSRRLLTETDFVEQYNLAFALQAACFDTKDYSRCLRYLDTCLAVVDHLDVPHLQREAHLATCSVMKGFVLRYIRQNDRAFKYLREAHARRHLLRPAYVTFLRAADLGALHLSRGLRLEAAGDRVEANKHYTAAEAIYRRDVTLDPSLVLPYGCLLERLGKPRQALEQLVKASDVTMDGERVYTAEDLVLLPGSVAEEFAGRQTVTVANAALAWYTRLRVHHKLQQPEAALKSLQALQTIRDSITNHEKTYTADILLRHAAHMLNADIVC